MGETAWGINPLILERVQTAYRDLKGGFCGLPLHDSMAAAVLPPMPSQVFRTEVRKGQLTVGVSPPSLFCPALCHLTSCKVSC